MDKKLLNEREIPAFGQTVTIRDLTIGEVLSFQGIEESEQVFHMISKMIVTPKFSPTAIKDMPAKYMNDITMLVEMSQGKQ